MRFARFAVLAAFALVACAPTAPATPPATGGSAATAAPQVALAENQTLRVAVGALPANPTPQALGGYWMQLHLFDPMTFYGENFQIQPGVATKWEVDTAGTTWTFTIRTDMTFSNGDPLTIDDVLFSFDTFNSMNWPTRSNFISITKFEKEGTNILKLTTAKPDMSIPNVMPNAFILPKKYFEQVGFQGFVTKPIGSAPYELFEYKANDTFHVKKRAAPHPFRKVANNEIIFKVVPEQGQVVNGLRTGELDAGTVYVFTAEQIQAMERDGNTVMVFPVSNVAIAFPSGAAELKNSPLKDIRVRQALNYAVDREALAKLNPGAIPTGQFSIPISGYWDKSVPAWPYDVNKAKQLLSEAGYPNGFKTTLEFQPNTLRQDLILAVQSMLKAVNVEVELAPLDFATNADKGAGRNNQQKSDLFGTVMGDSTGFSTSVRSNYGCGKPIGAPPAAVYWCNPAWETLMDQAITERDPARRQAIWLQANKIERDDVHVLYLYISPAQNVFGPKTKGMNIPTFQGFTLDSTYKIK